MLNIFAGGHVTGKPNSLQEAEHYCATGDGTYTTYYIPSTVFDLIRSTKHQFIHQSRAAIESFSFKDYFDKEIAEDILL